MTLNETLGPLVSLIATAVIAWLGHRHLSPKDHDRAALLARIAEDAAAVIVTMNPNAAWPDLLRDLVNRIVAGGSPTTNATAIENAATAALVRLGRGPGDASTR